MHTDDPREYSLQMGSRRVFNVLCVAALVGCGSERPGGSTPTPIGVSRSASTLPWVMSAESTAPRELAPVHAEWVFSAVWNGTGFFVTTRPVNGNFVTSGLDDSGAAVEVPDALRNVPPNIGTMVSTEAGVLLVAVGFVDGPGGGAGKVRGILVRPDASTGKLFDIDSYDLATDEPHIALASDGRKCLLLLNRTTGTSALVIDPTTGSASAPTPLSDLGKPVSNGKEYAVFASSTALNGPFSVTRIGLDGTVLSSNSVSPDVPGEVQSAASDGDGYLVVYTTPGSGTALRGQRFDASGALVGPSFIIGYGATAGADVGFDGTNYYAVWLDYSSPYNIYLPYAIRISPQGSVIKPVTKFPQVDAKAGGAGPRLAFDGSKWLIAMPPGIGFFAGPNGPIGSAFSLQSSNAVGALSGIATNGSEYVVLWRRREGANELFRGARVPFGTPAPTFEVLQGLPDDAAVGIVSDGRAYILQGESWHARLEGGTVTPFDPSLPGAYWPARGKYLFVHHTSSTQAATLTVTTADTNGVVSTSPATTICDGPGSFGEQPDNCVLLGEAATKDEYAFRWVTYSGSANGFFATRLDENGTVIATQSMGRENVNTATFDGGTYTIFPVSGFDTFLSDGSGYIVAGLTQNQAFCSGGICGGALFTYDKELRRIGRNLLPQVNEIEPSAGAYYAFYRNPAESIWNIDIAIMSNQGDLTGSQKLFDNAIVNQARSAKPESFLISYTVPDDGYTESRYRFLERGRTLGSACEATWQCLAGHCSGGTCMMGDAALPDSRPDHAVPSGSQGQDGSVEGASQNPTPDASKLPGDAAAKAGAVDAHADGAKTSNASPATDGGCGACTVGRDSPGRDISALALLGLVLTSARPRRRHRASPAL